MRKKREKPNRLFHSALIFPAAAMALCIGLLLLTFNGLFGLYKRNTARDSAGHLIEISRQVCGQVRLSVEGDRIAARSLAVSIADGRGGDEDRLFDYLRRQKKAMGVSGIRIYNESGAGFDENGDPVQSALSWPYVSRAVEEGEYFRVTLSSYEYAVSVSSDVLINGRRAVAVSVIGNMREILADKGIDSFGADGALYLTRDNGVLISTTDGESGGKYNITAVLRDGALSSLDGGAVTPEAVLESGGEGVYFFRAADGVVRYVTMMPASVMGENWFLFSLVPEKTVNATVNGFASAVLRIAGAVMVLFAAMTFCYAALFRRAEARHRRSLEKQAGLFDMLVSETDDVFLFMDRGREEPVYLSSNAAGMLGCGKIRADVSAPVFRFAEDGENGSAAAFNSALKGWDGTGEFVSEPLPFGEEGARRYLRLRLYPAKDGEDIVGIVQDVTREQQHAEDLRRALIMADGANRAKTQFLSSMSHDIRTPMNAIVNMARFAAESCAAGDSEKAGEYIAVIIESSDHLLRLVNDILDMSRIESGKLAIASQPFSLNTALEKVRGIIEPLCRARSEELVFDCGFAGAEVLGDELRLSQVLINLLNNAVKFTPEGGRVEFKAEELHSLRQDRAAFRFTVRDNGIGIAPEMQKTIFEPFVREDTDAVRGTEGSGLGLSIAKRFVDAMGGGISLSSEPGKGSVFTVELSFPLAAEPERARKKPAAARPAFPGRRALVADDNGMNLSIAGMLLGGMGFIVDTAGSGAEAMKLYTDGDRNYDIIFTDVQMPGMDGYELARAIRGSGRSDAADVPIVALTADVFAEDVEKARRAGMNAHVGKPIDPDELADVAAGLLESGRRPEDKNTSAERD